MIGLFHANPDTGRMAIAAHYHHDPRHIATTLFPRMVVGPTEYHQFRQMKIANISLAQPLLNKPAAVLPMTAIPSQAP